MSDETEEYVVHIPPESLHGMQELYAQVGDELFPRILYRLHFAGNMAVSVLASEMAENMMAMREEALEVYKVRGKPEAMSDMDAGIGLGISVASAFFCERVRELLPLNIDFDQFAEEIKRVLNEQERTRQ